MGLERIFHAQSVAIVGASQDERKRGYQAILALRRCGFEGQVYPVHPKEESILGLPCYRSVLAIPGPVDLALITTPATTVPGLLEQCGQKGIGGAVVIAGGFGELGEKGRALQERLVQSARRHGVRVVGPNTSGIISVRRGLNLAGIADVPRGDIALLSQSGNMALHLITEAALKTQKGFSYYIGVGNEADIKFHEYLEFLAADPGTRAIVIYVEGLSDGRRFLQQAYLASRDKPIVLLKSGRSSKGRRSAGSHTGALAGISEVARTAFGRAGILTIENSDELFPATEALASLPPMRDKRVAILADGGGHATIAADVLTDHGIEIPELSKATRDRLRAVLPANAALRNPIDVAGGTDSDPGVFAACARILLEDPHIDGLLLVGLFGGYGIRFAERLKFIEEDAAHQMGKLVTETKKPLVVHSLYRFAKPHSLELLRYYGIPVYDSLDIACKCVSVLATYGHYLATHHQRTNFVLDWGAGAKKRGRALIDGALAEGRHVLLESEARELLRLHGAPVPPDALARTAEEAVRAAKRLRGPVALKVVSPQILHKSEAGGVRLGLETPAQVRSAFREIVRSAGRYDARAEIRGCLVAPMAPRGVETIIGTKLDAQFGPVILFGLGGILVEVLKDVSTRVLPISRNAARRMLGELKGADILGGYRGKPPVDKDALAGLLLAISELVQAYPEIQELDLNPVVAHARGATVVDARILLRRNGSNHVAR
ncbi:MAG: acetate--CoA ligase family protein [Deltaproteobacteria bacterium]|nr:acetate--CoA ligase family protein [Deltaproteobacteria bacterium]